MRKELYFGGSLLALIFLAVGVFTPWGSLTNGHLGLVMLALIVAAIMLGFPTAFTLMGMGMFFTYLAYASVSPELAGQQSLDLMVQRAYAVMTNDVLISIPLFVFMGYLVERAQLVEKLFKALHLALANVPGSLAVATLITCAIFATATGIVGAVVTLMGLLAYPSMLKAGYDPKVGAGAITAGGCLGILIPPSVLLIVYGATAGVSVVQLYAGALFPGLMLAGLYIAYVVILAKLKPALMPALPEAERRVPLPESMQRLKDLVGPRALAVMGSIRAAGQQSMPDTRGVRVLVATPFLAVLLALAGMGLAAFAPEAAPEVVLEQSGFGADLELGGPVAEVDTPAEAAPASPYGPTWLWIVAGIGMLILLRFYWKLSYERLEVFRLVLKSVVPLAVLILAVLGSIVAGLATPTEAAAVGALGGGLLALAYGKLSFPVVSESVFLTGKTTAMVCWLFVGSSIFSAAFALLGGQEIVEKWVLSLGLSKIEFLVLSQVIIFLLGWPLEWTEIIVIFMPIFIPLLDNFGVDPLFFGLLVAINLQTAFLSPPVAMSAFYLKGVAPPHITLNQIFAGMMPFMGIQIVALFVLYIFPGIGMWLPTVLYR